MNLLDAMNALPDPAWCSGTLDAPIVVEGAPPDVEGAPPDAAWWILHSEPAPFGDAQGTRFDKAVRDSRRLKSRGATRVDIELGPVLDEIERALGTDCSLTAELLDVLVYPQGAFFVPHQDTPRHGDQLGTLVVEIPHAHRGGALVLRDHDREETFDWSVASGAARWIAMFGDVLHAVARVEEGLRLTAVYTLRYLPETRREPAERARLDALVDAAIALHDDAYDDSYLAIPCSRMVVAARDGDFPLTLASLRGADRLITAALVRAGLEVTVQECLAVTHRTTNPLAARLRDAERDGRLVVLRRPLPDHLLTEGSAISWDDRAHGDYIPIGFLTPYVDRTAYPFGVEWLVRDRARLVGRDLLYSDSGYFGNEYSDRLVYRFAMLFAFLPQNDALYA